MEDKQAQSEVWIRKKPRRILQNQALIVFCFYLCCVLPLPLSVFMFWLAFAVYPSIIIPAILVFWAIASAFYLAIHLKELKNKE